MCIYWYFTLATENHPPKATFCPQMPTQSSDGSQRELCAHIWGIAGPKIYFSSCWKSPWNKMEVIIGTEYNKITTLSGDPKTTSFVSLKHSLVTFQLCRFLLPKLHSIPVLIIVLFFLITGLQFVSDLCILNSRPKAFSRPCFRKGRCMWRGDMFDKLTLSNNS